MPEKIVSTTNPKIKNVVLLLKKAAARREQGLIVIEGLKETGLAIKAGLHINSVFYCQELLRREQLPRSLFSDPGEKNIFEVSRPVFEKISYRESTSGFVALAVPQHNTLDSLKLSANPLVVILESVEKPGNLGAVLRTADAAKVDALIVCDHTTDIYNPNAIRSSIGCVFTVQTAAATFADTIAWLRKNKIKSFAAALSAEKFYYETDLSGPSALVMGTESTGLTAGWIAAVDERIKIPMMGIIDSLNVSTSAAILIFEAMRQRKFV